MNTGIRHPFTGALYSLTEEGNVRIDNPDGTSGCFTGEGIWIDGDLRECDPQLCVWVSNVARPPAAPDDQAGSAAHPLA